MKRFMAAFFVAAAFGSFCQRSQAGDDRPEPLYEGKSLKYWVERLQKAGNDEERNVAVDALIKFGPDAAQALPELIPYLFDHSEKYQQIGCEILSRMGAAGKPAVPMLIRSLKEKTAPNPVKVIEVLAKIGTTSRDVVAPVLTESLRNHELVDSAMNALCELGPLDKAVLPSFREGLQHAAENEKVSYLWLSNEALTALAKLGEEVVPILVEFLVSKNNEQGSIKALGSIGSGAKKAVPVLAKELKHSNAEFRLEAARALWRIEKDQRAIPVLIDLLVEHQSDRAAELLGAIGPDAKSALPALKKALSANDGDYRFDFVLREAIRKIDPKSEIPVGGQRSYTPIPN